MKLHYFAFIFTTVFSEVVGHSTDEYGWALLDVSLPKQLSDHTASTGPDGLIYIAGGCDAQDGNVYIFTGDDEGFFACDSLSSSFFAFDPIKRSFQELPKLPRPRYRHSSSIVGNQVWIIGGRTLLDSLIPEVDVYDIQSNSWSTALLPTESLVSDHAGFAQEPNFVFIAGGFDHAYHAVANVTRINSNTLSNGTLQIEAMAPLRTARGDIIGVSSSDGLSAYVTGGFTHENGFCAPLKSTEQYTFASNQWGDLPPLDKPRGEVVLVEVDDHIYAIGGERQIEGICDGAGDDLDPGEKTVGTDEVEILDLDGNSFKPISGFPTHRFRFAAAVDQNGIIYAFGGQTNHAFTCQCFRTTDDISVFGKGLGSAAIRSSTLFSLLTVVAMVFSMVF